ncbi:MAG: hypothetical protein Aureis2KO_14690 [Aureisphaera sp.]
MKKNYVLTLVLCLLYSSLVLSQSKDLEELQEQFWNPKNKNASVVDVPEKWQDESAVILYIDEYYKYTNNGKKMYNPSHFHQRVKLLDKAAVEDFSEFSFEKNSGSSFGFVNFYREKSTVGIKVIKPSGEEIIIDVDAESVEQDKEKKIAIPNLEIGDVVDLFIFEDDFQRTFSGTHIYDPVERVISRKYPVLFTRVAVEVENDYFLNMESFNGAPAVKEEQTDKKSTRRYVIESSDVEKSEFPRWFYPLAELPSLKFQVTFALRSKNQYYASVFLADKDAERKADVTKEEIIEYYGKNFEAQKRGSVKDVLRYLEDKGISGKRKQLESALYYLRHKSYNRFLELYIARENNIRYSALPCDTDYVILDENTFVNYFAGLAKQLEIDYDIIVATPDYNGTIDNLLLRSNVAYGLRFNFPKPMYLFEVSPHVQSDYFPENLEGTKVYTLSVKKNRKFEDVAFDVLPVTTADENMAKQVVNVNFEDNFKKITIDREQHYKGQFKPYELRRRLVFEDFLNEEFKRYETKHFYNCKKRQNKSDQEAQSKMKSVMKTYRDRKIERIEKIVSSEFDVEIKEYDYEIDKTGRYSNDALIIKDQFVIENEFVKKAGPNYLVEVGKFIGGQVQLEADEIERTKGVYLDHAKTYKYEVSIAIPEGYEVVGLDKLQRNSTNATGAFTAEAVVEDGTLKYTTTKIYAKRKYEVSEWSSMVPWIQDAYDFSQEKVMFKKI